ncbi:hypothetical protein CE91St46_08540 [Eubacteriales bacterium]|nr:hypothetical protein CE91St46_08540 [Eubacteriales bacterium]GKH62379.1 hypothetical protein CE91St47_08480 [Eubacteriales bacterium]
MVTAAISEQKNVPRLWQKQIRQAYSLQNQPSPFPEQTQFRLFQGTDQAQVT